MADIKYLRYIGASGLPDTIDLTASGNVLQVAQLQVVNPGISASLPLKLDASKKLASGLIALTSEVTGVLPIANGGTNSSTALNSNRIMTSVAGAIVEHAALTVDRVLITDANGLPEASIITQTELEHLDNVSGNIQNQLNQKEVTSNKGIAGGYASLDGGGKVPIGQLPNTIMQYVGLWNATTNTPALADGGGNPDESIGDVYRVSVSGTQNLGSGSQDFAVGDYAILNNSKVWEKADTTDSVISVNGFTGAVTLTTTNVAEGTNLYYTAARFNTAFSGKSTTDLAEGTNLYFTDSRARTAAVSDAAYGAGWDGVTTIAPSKNAVYDKIESMSSALVSDVAYAGSWDGVSGIAPSKNAVYDKIQSLTTTDIAEGTNLYYTASRFNTAFSGKSTTDLAEGTNLYHTTSRARTASVVNSMAGSETDQAPSVSSVKTYINNSVSGLTTEMVDYETDLVAGESFAANRSFAVRWALNGETAGRVYKASKDPQPSTDPTKFYATGVIQTTGALSAADPIAHLIKVAKFALKSGDAAIAVADQGKPLFLQESGVFSAALPGAGVTSGSKYAIVIVGNVVKGHASDPTLCVVDIGCASPVHHGLNIAP